jgi:hypothetical protein
MTRIGHNSTQRIAEDRCRLFERYPVFELVPGRFPEAPFKL